MQTTTGVLRPGGPRIAVVHDYLTQRGGAERVALALLEACPDARLVTSVYDAEGTYPEFRGYPVETLWLDRFRMFRKDPRRALPLLPRAFEQHLLDEVDVVICSSSGFAHGIGTRGAKVVYCHNPPRFLYQPHEYFSQLTAGGRALVARAFTSLRRWDKRAAASATVYLVNSSVVRERVKRSYGIDARILPPPVSLDIEAAREAVPDLAPGYLLTVSRRRGYKNAAVIAEAISRRPGERLVVVGGLPPRAGGSGWPPNVVALEGVSDAQLRWLYANADALIAVSSEDFGLTPVEAYCFGTPALVLRRGGYLDTSVEHLTGEWVLEPTPEAIIDALRRFRARSWDREAIAEYAQAWSPTAFARSLHEVIGEVAGSVQVEPSGASRRVSRPRVVTRERRFTDAWVRFERRGARHAREDRMVDVRGERVGSR